MNLVSISHTTYPDGSVVKHQYATWVEPRQITKREFIKWKLYLRNLLMS